MTTTPTAGPVPGAALAADPDRGRARGGAPLSAALGLLVALSILAASTVPLRDLDVYWHLLAGRELASGLTPSQIGADWSYAARPSSWTSTQWLAELLLYWLHALGGWWALAAFRIVTLSAILGILAVTTLRGRPVVLAGGPFLMAAYATWLSSEERPQQATYLGAAVLGAVLLSGLRRGALPRWWLVVPLTILWANLHGGWILVPGVLGLVAVGRRLDHGWRDGAVRRAGLLAMATLAAGLVSPAGLANLTSVLRFSAAAQGLIEEWDRTAPFSVQGLSTIGMLVLVVAAWTRRGAPRVPRSESVVVLLLLLFAWMAYRNVTPALLLLAPVVADRMCLAFGPERFAPEPRWSRPLGVALAVLGTCIALGTLGSRQLLPVDRYPVNLSERIAAMEGEQRVLNSYGVAGLVLYFGGDSTQVGIDGRTDRYGEEYISSYLDLLNLRGEWSAELAGLAPTAALIESTSGLAHVLQSEREWTEVATEGDWVLLVAPAEHG